MLFEEFYSDRRKGFIAQLLIVEDLRGYLARLLAIIILVAAPTTQLPCEPNYAELIPLHL